MDLSSELLCRGGGVMVTWDTPITLSDRMMDRGDRKHDLPATSLAGGNNWLVDTQ